MNQCIVIGRIAENPTIKETKDGKICNLSVYIPHNNKNSKGEYENDIIPIILKGNIAENTVQHCFKGNLLAIKGRLASNKNGVFIDGERITFLSQQNDKDIDKDMER